MVDPRGRGPDHGGDVQVLQPISRSSFARVTAIFVQQSELEAALFGGSFSFGDDRTVLQPGEPPAHVRRRARGRATAGVSRRDCRQPCLPSSRPRRAVGRTSSTSAIVDADPLRAAAARRRVRGRVHRRIAAAALRAKVVRARAGGAEGTRQHAAGSWERGSPATTSHSASGSFRPSSRCRAATPSRSTARPRAPRWRPNRGATRSSRR